MGAAPRGPAINSDALEAFRKMRGLTQTALGELAGCHPAHICRLESGQRPRPSIALTTALAAALEVPVRALLAANEDRLTKVGAE